MKYFLLVFFVFFASCQKNDNNNPSTSDIRDCSIYNTGNITFLNSSTKTKSVRITAPGSSDGIEFDLPGGGTRTVSLNPGKYNLWTSDNTSGGFNQFTINKCDELTKKI